MAKQAIDPISNIPIKPFQVMARIKKFLRDNQISCRKFSDELGLSYVAFNNLFKLRNKQIIKLFRSQKEMVAKIYSFLQSPEKMAAFLDKHGSIDSIKQEKITVTKRKRINFKRINHK